MAATNILRTDIPERAIAYWCVHPGREGLWAFLKAPSLDKDSLSFVIVKDGKDWTARRKFDDCINFSPGGNNPENHWRFWLEERT